MCKQDTYWSVKKNALKKHFINAVHLQEFGNIVCGIFLSPERKSGTAIIL